MAVPTLVNMRRRLIGFQAEGALWLVAGIAYLRNGRNLWPLMIAHSLVDTARPACRVHRSIWTRSRTTPTTTTNSSDQVELTCGEDQ
jgi:hypothetical protein